MGSATTYRIDCMCYHSAQGTKENKETVYAIGIFPKVTLQFRINRQKTVASMLAALAWAPWAVP